ncbi:PDPFL protein, partial [Thalassarche chlororhynchos]|nr:PDPFL protein [Thalassarche chlororhynchos]
MASVPSAGCLLAKNQYYRSKCSGAGSQCLIVCAFSPFAGLPELIDKCWWIKSFFHCEPSPPTVGRKTLSAS